MRPVLWEPLHSGGGADFINAHRYHANKAARGRSLAVRVSEPRLLELTLRARPPISP